MKARWVAAKVSPLEGPDAVIPALTADQCKKASRQELTADLGKMHAASAKAAKDCELWARKGFKDFETDGAATPRLPIADTRWVHT